MADELTPGQQAQRDYRSAGLTWIAIGIFLAIVLKKKR